MYICLAQRRRKLCNKGQTTLHSSRGQRDTPTNIYLSICFMGREISCSLLLSPVPRVTAKHVWYYTNKKRMHVTNNIRLNSKHIKLIKPQILALYILLEKACTLTSLLGNLICYYFIL